MQHGKIGIYEKESRDLIPLVIFIHAFRRCRTSPVLGMKLQGSGRIL